jgi:hypothetical protein
MSPAWSKTPSGDGFYWVHWRIEYENGRIRRTGKNFVLLQADEVTFLGREYSEPLSEIVARHDWFGPVLDPASPPHPDDERQR